MFNGFCQTGAWGSLGGMGVWNWVGLILHLGFWIGLLAGFILLVSRIMRRARVPGSTEQPTAKEILQAQYARGEITRVEYESKKQEIG